MDQDITGHTRQQNKTTALLSDVFLLLASTPPFFGYLISPSLQPTWGTCLQLEGRPSLESTGAREGASSTLVPSFLRCQTEASIEPVDLG